MCILVSLELERTGFLVAHAGSSMGERRAFASFTLLCLRCATVKGACALINERSTSGGEPGRSCRGVLPLPEPKGRPMATRSRVTPRKYLDTPPPWHATTFPTPPPFPPNAEVVARGPVLPGVFDDPGPPASPTAGVPMPHAPPPPQGQAAVTTAFDPPRTPESPVPTPASPLGVSYKQLHFYLLLSLLFLSRSLRAAHLPDIFLVFYVVFVC